MSERPILFSAPMVLAILAGAKTQTRRAIKAARPEWIRLNPQPHPDADGRLCFGWDGNVGYPMRCPYGQPGDKLWVREAYMPDPPDDGTWAGTAWRGCRDSQLEDIPERFRTPAHCIHRATWQGGDLVGWRPSIHMPRWASRITLEITGVRVEKLQDISEADARAEGCRSNADTLAETGYATCRDAFRDLWESINGPGSWDANHWVWCIEFRRLEAGNV